MNSDDSIVCRFVLGSEDVDQTQPLSKLDKAQLFVGQMIDIDEAYYAYRAEWNGSYVRYASFYVLSPKNGYFVEIHNKM